MLKKLLLYIVLSLGVLKGISQQNDRDSLRYLLNANPDDTTKISLHLALSKIFLEHNLDSFTYYSQKALRLSEKNDAYQLPAIYSNIGLGHFYNSNIDSARYYYDQALLLLDQTEDSLVRARIYGNYSMTYLTSEDFESRVNYNLKAIELAKKHPKIVATFYYNHAVMYGGRTGMADQSKKYLKLALNAAQEGGNYVLQATSLRGFAYYCMEENKMDSAQYYLQEGLKLCERTGIPKVCFESNIEAGRFYTEVTIYEKAKMYLENALYYALSRNRKYDIMQSYLYLAQNEFERENYNEAIEHLEKFDISFKEEPAPEIGLFGYDLWYKTEAKVGNFKRSTELLEYLVFLKDSIYNQRNRVILAEADSKFEVAKKDKELAEQQLQLQQQQGELQKRKTQNAFMAGIMVFLLVTFVMGWFLYQQRQKRKNQEILALKREQQVKTLESLMEGEEKERLRIAKELHDGVNGDLAAIKYKLTSLVELNEKVIDETVEMIDQSCEQVRAISHNLVPPSLEKFNIIEVLEDYCNTMNQIQEPVVSFQHLGENIQVSKNAEVNIYRIIQELVSNAIKHAVANEITVQISNRDKHVQITVEDDGKGFDVMDGRGKGIGLKNVTSRVKYLNAEMDYHSNDQGTSCTIEMDIDKLTQ